MDIFSEHGSQISITFEHLFELVWKAEIRSGQDKMAPHPIELLILKL